MFRTIAKFTIGLLICYSHECFGQIAFQETQEQAGISEQQLNYGCYLGDFNNDGYDDLFITRRSGDAFNSLYENNRDGTFSDVSCILNNQSKHSSAAIWFDYNNDGWQDLLIANNVQEGHVLLRNNRDETFTDVTESAGVGGIKKETKSVNAADLNGDGWLDLYLNNFGEDNELYLNNRDETFTESVKISGVNHKGRAMGVVIFDYDNDTDQDIFLTFDGQPFVLYENNGLAQFIDVSLRTQTNLTGFGMGADIADINGDGFMDIYVTNLYENFLMTSNGDLTFSENGKTAGVADLGMGWGCNFVDVDNDGYPEIYVTNEYGFSPKKNVLYKNMRNLTFDKIADDAISSPYSGFGSAISDFNQDGKQDIFISNTNYVYQILANQSEAGNWIKIKLLDPQENWHAVGAQVQLTSLNSNQMDQLTAGSGHASQSSNIFHFGLGVAHVAESIKVTWPNGDIQKIGQLEANQTYLLVKDQDPNVFEPDNYLAQFPSQPLISLSTLDVSEKNRNEFYPNPVTHFLNIKDKVSELTVINNSGQRITIHPNNISETTFDLSTLPKGLYFLKINNRWKKLIIQR